MGLNLVRVEQLVAYRAHDPKVVGSNPTPDRSVKNIVYFLKF